MTKIEIIDETVKFYENNPRAIGNRSCIYLTKEGNKCAHSRCLDLTDEELFEINNSQARSVILKYGDEVHKPQYQGHAGEFWSRIQNLHDFHEHWDGMKLTEEGESYVKGLKSIYAGQ